MIKDRFEVLNDTGKWYVFDHKEERRLIRDYDSYAAAFNTARSMNQGYMVPLRSDYAGQLPTGEKVDMDVLRRMWNGS